jgi:hypothetical protein
MMNRKCAEVFYFFRIETVASPARRVCSNIFGTGTLSVVGVIAVAVGAGFTPALLLQYHYYYDYSRSGR